MQEPSRGAAQRAAGTFLDFDHRVANGWHALRYSEGRGESTATRRTPFGVPQSVPPIVIDDSRVSHDGTQSPLCIDQLLSVALPGWQPSPRPRVCQGGLAGAVRLESTF